MSAVAKRKEKLQAKMGAMREQYGNGKCWVCDSISGVKTSREGSATRCVRCVETNQTNEAVEQYASLKAQFAKIKDRT